MQVTDLSQAPTDIRNDLGVIFISLELSRFKLADHIAAAG